MLRSEWSKEGYVTREGLGNPFPFSKWSLAGDY